MKVTKENKDEVAQLLKKQADHAHVLSNLMKDTKSVAGLSQMMNDYFDTTFKINKKMIESVGLSHEEMLAKRIEELEIVLRNHLYFEKHAGQFYCRLCGASSKEPCKEQCGNAEATVTMREPERAGNKEAPAE